MGLNFTTRLFAHIGGAEPFVQELIEEMPTLVDAGMIDGAKREDVKRAILAISFEGLMPAFEHLKRIRAAVGKRVPELNRKQHYEDFAVALWMAYKTLMPRATELMDFNIGFLFQNDQKFETGLAEFLKGLPPRVAQLGPFLRAQRTEWQNELAGFRNFLQHRNAGESLKYVGLYEPEYAEAVFERVWQTIAEILALFLSLHLWPGTWLVEIPAEERDPVRPRRFRFAIEGLNLPGPNLPPPLQDDESA